MSLINHTGPHWRVDLPGDWTRREDRDGVPYFESADGHAGLYIAAVNIHSIDRAVEDVLQEFADSTAAGQDTIPGHAWVHQTHRLGDGDWLLESTEASHGHRILTRFIVVLPLVLYASFHDYDFTDVATSNARLGPSLQAVWLTDLGVS